MLVLQTEMEDGGLGRKSSCNDNNQVFGDFDFPHIWKGYQAVEKSWWLVEDLERYLFDGVEELLDSFPCCWE